MPMISQLQEQSDKFWKDPFTLSQQLRKKFRADKKVREKEQKEAQGIRDKHNFLFDILPSSAEDTLHAKTVEFEGSKAKTLDQLKKTIQAAPLFKKPQGKASSQSAKEGLRELLTRQKRLMKDPFALK
ncbi:hypothetical protein HDU96_007384 [Phlyctochytrium bullatum]|nr:hypothetical protein HDU96_007384 [Phlyctochytrium bullatum]